MVKDINAINESLFESIKHINEYGMEYWTARELLKVLQYGEYRFFSKVIDKAIDACIASKNDVRDHFVHVHEMVNIGSSAKRRLDDYHLSRYACYLIARKILPNHTMHDFRHTYATRLLSSGMDIKTVASLLGDTISTVERVYIHYTDEMREKAADDINKIFGS